MTKILLTLFISFSFGVAQAQYTKIYDFDSIPTGSMPYGTLTSDGNFLYGLTNAGGANGKGVIYKIKPDGTLYSKLLDFNGTGNGANPASSSRLYFDGNYLYGTTFSGGLNNIGVIFRIKPDGTGDTVLHHFTGTGNSAQPRGSLVSDGSFLYGIANGPGPTGVGCIFKIKPDGTAFSVVLNFSLTDGWNPHGALLYDGTFLYGTTTQGGITGNGTLFKIKPDGTGFVKLYDFNGTTTGKYPHASLISDGTWLYGSTGEGGTNDNGTLFKIYPDGTGYTKLFDFTGAATGRTPMDLVFDGIYLYGTTHSGGSNGRGALYKIKPDGSGFIRLYSMSATGISGGEYGNGGLLYEPPYLYGATIKGGLNGDGTLFRYTLVTDLKETLKESGITVFPNPSSGKFTLQNNDPAMGTGEIVVYNILGETVYSCQVPDQKASHEIDLSQFSKGIYFIRYTDGKSVAEEKIILE